MRKSSAFALALALALPLAPAASFAYDAGAAKNMDVRFRRGATDATYSGSIRGTQYHNYRFYAQQGQVLNVDMGESNPNLDVIVRYLGNNHTDMLGTQDQVLPYTGPYEVRVLQNRNSARRSRQARPYALVIAITGKGAAAPARPAPVADAPELHPDIVHQQWIAYRCDGGQRTRTRYYFGEAGASAELEVGERTLGMRLDNHQSSRDMHVFTGEGYKWTLDNKGSRNVRRAGNGFLFRSTMSNVGGQRMPVDEIVRKNCMPVR